MAVSFDFVAPFYQILERIVFGSKLQTARMAFVPEITRRQRVLVVGEGDGRFLAEFVEFWPESEIVCVEASRRMIERARKRTVGHRIRFLCSALEDANLPERAYDLVVTHFFLDCFSENKLPQIVAQIARAAAPQAQWLIAEFHQPTEGWRRWFSRCLIRAMYLFFRICAGIEGHRLSDYRLFLRAHGFELSRATGLPNGMIRSELWSRGRVGRIRGPSPGGVRTGP